MADNIVVAGTGMTKFGKYLERGVRSLAEEALNEALKDAGLEPRTSRPPTSPTPSRDS